MESDEIIQLLKSRKATKCRVSVKRPKGRLKKGPNDFERASKSHPKVFDFIFLILLFVSGRPVPTGHIAHAFLSQVLRCNEKKHAQFDNHIGEKKLFFTNFNQTGIICVLPRNRPLDL